MIDTLAALHGLAGLAALEILAVGLQLKGVIGRQDSADGRLPFDQEQPVFGLGAQILLVDILPSGRDVTPELFAFLQHLEQRHVEARVPLELQPLHFDAVRLDRLPQRYLEPVQAQVARLSVPQKHITRKKAFLLSNCRDRMNYSLEFRWI